MKTFDLENTPLETGRTLIEASAGTGKTYALAAIFARLLIEHSLGLEEILVCTFTEAATAELRERIRRMLREAVRVFRGGTAEEFSFIGPLARKHADRAATLLPELEAALRNVDQAAIFTIHGFCQRLLQDRAFESGMPVETEVLPDESDLRRAILEDFWRRQAQNGDPWLERLLLAHFAVPDDLLFFLGKILSHPEVHFAGTPLTLPDAAARWLAEFQQTRSLWEQHKAGITELLTADYKWGNKPFSKPETVRQLLAEAAGTFASDGDFATGLAALTQLAESSLAAKVSKKNKAASSPRHPFFAQCERLVTAEKNYAESLVIEAVHWTRTELIRRKRQSRLIGYNDMLADLDRVLASATPDAVTRLRGRWRAVLLDEFQDTDPLQERIFRRLFERERHWIYLIGDPKQAIYGFRGADLQTYLHAARDCDAQWSLGTNHRSEPRLVEAVNALFSVRNEPFGTPGIVFQPVKPKTPPIEPLLVDGNSAPPLEMWFAAEECKADEAEERLISAVATETKRLLESDSRIGEKRLAPGEIAVLTVTNPQASRVQTALQRMGIPAVVRSGANVFQTGEAQAFSRLLAALAEPRRDGLLRAALATPLFGWTAEDIFRLGTDEALWSDWAQKLQNWRRMWLEHGFMAMQQDLLRVAGTREQLLRGQDGERALTNVLQLGELLHGATLQGFREPIALWQWLEARRTGGESNDAWEQRLETDSAAVQILTSHSSKGLEFPVVFVPFAWKGLPPPRKKEPLLWHHDDQLFCQLREEDRAEVESLIREELLQEKLRLLYVAVTRAKQRCYLAVHPGNLSDTSALHRLLTIGDEVNDQTLRTQFDDCAGIRITKLPEFSGDRYEPPREKVKSLQPRNFHSEIRRDWRIASFSSLTHDDSNEEPDRDRFFVPQTVLEPLTGAAALPPGTALGLCLHEIFEKIDFTEAGGWPLIVRSSLRRSVLFSTEAEAAILQMLKQVVAALDLQKIQRKDRLEELEFLLPLGTLTLPKLHAACAETSRPIDWERLRFSQVCGLLKGFMDLVFRRDGKYWLLDWKSNFLAPTPAGYDQATMTTAMRHSQYGLQYLLYCVALRRLLWQRVAGFEWDRDFGGVAYVFLRGVDPTAPGQGIFADRPPETLLIALDALFV